MHLMSHTSVAVSKSYYGAYPSKTRLQKAGSTGLLVGHEAGWGPGIECRAGGRDDHQQQNLFSDQMIRNADDVPPWTSRSSPPRPHD